MKIDITISDATPAELEAIAKVLNVKPQAVQKSKEPLQKSKPALQKSKPKKRRWSKTALTMVNTRTPEAPYGYKVDGTPRKPTGIQKEK